MRCTRSWPLLSRCAIVRVGIPAQSSYRVAQWGYLLAAFAMVAAMPLPAGALNPGVYVWNEGGALYDVGRTMTQVTLDSWPEGRYGGSFGCNTLGFDRDGATFRITVPVNPTEASAICQYFQRIPLGVLTAGSYRVEANFVRPDGTPIESRTADFEIKRRDVLCNVSPEHHLLELWFAGPDTSRFVQRFETDPAFRASLANISIHPPRVINGYGVISAEFDPLADPQRVLAAVRGSDEFAIVRYYAPDGCGFATCPGSVVRDAVEYFHAGNEQYFFTDDPVEIDALDRGVPNRGWSRTGETFRVIYRYGEAMPIEGRVQKAYRFWDASATGKASHFFTLDQRECAVLRDRTSWNWTFEGTPFWAFTPENGVCTVGVPLYRIYNNGLGGAPLHRYTTRPGVVDEMVNKGWVSEGVVMCVSNR